MAYRDVVDAPVMRDMDLRGAGKRVDVISHPLAPASPLSTPSASTTVSTGSSEPRHNFLTVNSVSAHSFPRNLNDNDAIRPPFPSSPLSLAGMSNSTGSEHTIAHYRIEKTIGQGTYGKVKLGTNLYTDEKGS